MFSFLKCVHGAGYRAGQAGRVACARKVGECQGRKRYVLCPGALNPYRLAPGLTGWLKRRIWEAGRLEGQRERLCGA